MDLKKKNEFVFFVYEQYIFDHLCTNKILGFCFLQKKAKMRKRKIIKIVAWVVKQYIMIATKYSFFLVLPPEILS